MKEIEKENKKISCNDKKCPIHGKLKTRGRTFKGRVIRKKQRHVTIDQERLVFHKKYERYSKLKGKLHAHLPECMTDSVKKGDLIEIKECRHLSKTIYFVVTKKIK